MKPSISYFVLFASFAVKYFSFAILVTVCFHAGIFRLRALRIGSGRITF